MTIRKKIIIFSIFFATFVVGIFFSISNSESFHLFQGAEAVGGYSYQIGLTSVMINKCIPSCCSMAGCRCCIGDEYDLCATILTEAQCSMYSAVSGTPAGGMGSFALFSNLNIGTAGLSPGGQLIAGGMSPVLMDSGVLASAGGCAGCMAKANKIDKIKEVFDYMIASFKK